MRGSSKPGAAAPEGAGRSKSGVSCSGDHGVGKFANADNDRRQQEAHQRIDAFRQDAAWPEAMGAEPRISALQASKVGASDARHYRHFEIPSVVFGPTPFNMGGPDKDVLIDELLAIAKVHALAAFDFLTKDQ